MISKQEVYDTLQEYFDRFLSLPKQANDEWRELVGCQPVSMEGATSFDKAVFMNRRMGELLKAALSNDPNVSINEIHRSKLFTIKNDVNEIEITLRCKKLNKNRRTMNIRTPRNRRIWHQNQRAIPGFFEQSINVTLGWLSGPAGTPKELNIVFELHDRLEWHFQIDGNGVPYELPAQGQLFDVVDEPAPYTVTLRDTDRAKHVANQGNKGNADKAN